MHETLLDLLRCPFCGTAFDVVQNDALVSTETGIESGVLGCECCAFPIIAGIPVLLANDDTRRAMHLLEAGQTQAALLAVLGLDPARTAAFNTLATSPYPSCRELLPVLSPDAEGTYFLYRFSDPTFVPAEALIRALGVRTASRGGPRLDLCGGMGHLTRALRAGLEPVATGWDHTVVADLHFWKLWLATRYTSPGCAAVCCNADAPLPFGPNQFSMVVLMDAFPYIWHKRLCADEMIRVARPDAMLALPHLHSSRGDNFSAGDPLSPDAYRDLFDAHSPRFYSDRQLLDTLLEEAAIDLTQNRSAQQIGDEASLTIVASGVAPPEARLDIATPTDVTGTLIVNPLYAVEYAAGVSTLRLQFPDTEYEAEFGECRRYLPDPLRVDVDLTTSIQPMAIGPRYEELRRRRVLLDVPLGYL